MYQIENELQETVHSPNDTLVLYMEQLESASREAGIVVPLTCNEKGERSISWSRDYQDVRGSVNVYGLDSYPSGLSCIDPDSGFNLVRNYYQWFQNYSFTQPEFFPEFEGGYFTPWGGSFYDSCSSELSPESSDVYYKNNIGQRATLQNLYMAFGGTNWGQSAAPVVYTSYDYSAPLRETREIRDKLKQTKLLGLFTRVSKDLLKTNMESNGTGYAVSDVSIWIWVLRNPETGAGFYVLQHNVSSSTASTTFSLYANTSTGRVSIPNINLNGRQSKIVVIDYKFGKNTLLYSSAEVLTYANLDVDVLVLYLGPGQIGEFAFRAPFPLNFTIHGAPLNLASIHTNMTSKFIYTQGSGKTIVKLHNGILLYLLDRQTAYNFHAPPTTTDPNVFPNEHVFVLGHHLLRKLSYDGNTVKVVGDSVSSTSIESMW